MKNSFEIKVYYSDTDSYGVVWHGSYLRWMEMGRVELSEELGLNLKELEANDIVLPVVDLNIRYKSSGKLDDTLVVETSIESMTVNSVTFAQIIKNKSTDKICTSASVKIVAINKSGALYRKLPNQLKTGYETALQNVPSGVLA